MSDILGHFFWASCQDFGGLIKTKYTRYGKFAHSVHGGEIVHWMDIVVTNAVKI